MSGMSEIKEEVSDCKSTSDYGLYVGITFGIASIFFFLLQANGVEVNWVISATVYALCTIVIVWTTLRHALPARSSVARYTVIVLLVLVCMTLGTCGTVKQYQKEHLKRQATPAPTLTTAPNYSQAGSRQDVPKTPKEETIQLPPTGKVQGSDNTLVGDVGKRSITGNGNTIVGATDSNGNTILNRGGTAIGRGATADQTGIAIGAGAHAGNQKQQNIDTNNGIVIGGDNNGTATVNVGPPPLVLTVASVESPGTAFLDKPGFIKTEITIVPNQQVTAPFTIALDFDNPISDIDNTVKGVGAQMVGGPFRRGIHARDTVDTSIGPSHPLVVVVFSLLPVKLVSVPRIEF